MALSVNVYTLAEMKLFHWGVRRMKFWNVMLASAVGADKTPCCLSLFAFSLHWERLFFFEETGFLFCCKDLFYSFSYYCNESHQLQFLILFCRLLGIFWKCARIGEYFFMHNIVTFFSPSGTKTLADLVAFNLILSILSRWAEESLGGVLLCHHGFQYTVSSVAKGPKDNQLNGDIWRNGQTVKCGRSYLRSTLRHWVAAALITYRSQAVMEMSLLQRRSRSL